MKSEMEDHDEETGLTFYLRLPSRIKDMDNEYIDTLDALIDMAEMKNQGWIIIFGGQANSCLKLNNLHCFKKQAPWRLRLKTLEHPVLAEIALQEIKHRGYMLTVGGDINADEKSLKKMMVQIVREKLTKEDIESRNVYLAKDCVDKAISSLNLRVKEQLDLEQDNMDKGIVDEDLRKNVLPFVLHLQDFDITKISKTLSEKAQKEVDEKIINMLGFGSVEDENSPLHWFDTQRKILKRQQQQEEAEQEGTTITNTTSTTRSGETKENVGASGGVGISDQSCWDFNIIVEGSEGVGKSNFMKIATEFLHAYGKLKNPKLRTSKASMMIPDSYGTMDDANKKVSDVFDAARNEKDAPLFIKDGHLLSPGGAGIDLKPQTISQYKSAAQVIITETTNAPFVALSCEAGTYRSLVTIHQSIEQRFPHHVILTDPTVTDILTTILSLCAEKNIAFSIDLKSKLKDFLIENHCSNIKTETIIGGFSLAKKMVNDALRKRKERISKAVHQKDNSNKKKERERNNEEKSETKTETKSNHSNLSTTTSKIEKENMSECLLPIDFKIGEEIGDPEMREEVYREMAGLIGMKEAKEWLELVRSSIDLANISGKRSGLKRCYNLVLTGKPGTGKTTFARLVHKFLKAHGVLTGEFVEKNALELKGEYVGSTTPLVKACFQEAKGGTLFLDEAYGLASDNFKGK